MAFQKKSILLLLFLMINTFVYNQIELQGQYRARPEFLNGYKQPLLKSEKPNFYISQRARLGLQYTHPRFQFNFIAQDVRVWGSTASTALDDKGYLSIFEANAMIKFSEKWMLKLGRQPIQYDNGRIFGVSDWGMSARRHDAAILRYKDSTWQVDVGASYNQMSGSSIKTIYELNNYKTFQYAWANKKWSELSLSLLFVNNGMEHIYMEDSIKNSKINYTQTFGTYLTYDKPKFNLQLYGYYQMGVNQHNQTLHAYNVSASATIKPIKNIKMTLGGEILSGTSQAHTINDRSQSFSPLYHSLHPLNGYMDYFYAGNHEESVGLINPFLKIAYQVKKLEFGIDNHLFYAAADVQNDKIQTHFEKSNPFLGYELDFTLKYKLLDEISFQLGYSIMSGTETMRILKNADHTKASHWGYIMISITPFKNLAPLLAK